MPDPRPAVKLNVLKTEETGRVVRQLVRYESEPGLMVEGYLLQLAGRAEKPKRPGIVALHQTTKASIDEIAGVSGPPDMQIGFKLAERGFVVFCPRCFLWQDSSSYDDAVAQHRRRHSESLGMAKMLYDAMRSVDVLVSLPEVDASRIGAVGHSLGAKEALYLAAFDERIKTAVASEGGLGLRSTNWDAPLESVELQYGLRQLRELGLVESSDHRDCYFVTHEGYLLADQILAAGAQVI